MRWLRSDLAPPLRDWAVAAGIGWVWSVPVGLVLWVGASLLKGVASDAALYVMGAALALVFAPAFSWVGLALALPAAFVAARQGWLGLPGAVAIGALSGAVAASILGGTSAIFTAGFGAITLAIMWGALRRMARAG
jgi:hypothetical protein